MNNKNIAGLILIAFLLTFIGTIISFFSDQYVFTFSKYLFMIISGALILRVLRQIYLKQSEKIKSNIKEKLKIIYFIFLLLLIISFLDLKILNSITKFLQPVQFHITIITLILGFMTFYTNKDVLDSILIKKNEKNIFYITILIISTLIFLINYFTTYNYFFGGEFHSYFATKGIVNSFIPRMPSGVIYFRNFVFHYYVAIFALILGLSKVTFKIAIVSIFIPALILTYNLVKKYFNRETAIIAYLLLLSSPWTFSIISSTRFFPFALSLILICYYQTDLYFTTKTKKSFIILLLLMLVTILTESIGLGIFAFILYYSFTKRHELTKHQKIITYAAFGFLIIFGALFVLFPKMYNIPETQTIETQELGKSIYIDILIDSFKNFSYNISFINFVSSSHGFIFSLLLISLPTLLIFRKKSFYIFYNSFFLFTLLGFGFLKFWKLQPRNISVFFPYMYLPVAFTIVFLIYLYFKDLRKLAINTIILMLLVLLIFNNSVDLKYMSFTNVDHYDISVAGDHIDENYKEGDIIMSTLVWGWDNAYLEHKLNYTIRTKGYENPAIIVQNDENNYSLLFHKVPVLFELEQIENVIDSGKRVWIIYHYRTQYNNDKETMEFFRVNQDKVVDSVDQYKLYLFNK